MTGIASNGTYTYVLGDGYSGGDPLVEYFSGTGSIQTNPYIDDLPALTAHYDIGYEGGNSTGDIWAASDAADSPIKAYDTNGMLVSYIPEADLPAGIQPRGLCFDTSGYLWVSDENSDKIYKVDISSGVTGGGLLQEAHLALSSNPFSASVTISIAGVSGQPGLAIYDLTGRAVFTAQLSASGSFNWDGRAMSGEAVPFGTYIIRVTTPAGDVIQRLVTKL